ncbi:MAG: LapA family protein [Myxococcota bacterium]
MKWVRTAIVSAITLGLLWVGWSFRAGNAGTVDVDLVWARLPGVELWWALSAAVVFGAAASALFVGLAWLRQRIVNRRHRSTIARLEGELHELRSLPLSGSVRAETDESLRRVRFGQG